MLEVYGYCCEADYGMTCGVILAESEEEAKKIVGTYSVFETVTLTHIPMKKGFTCIGSYDE